MTDPQAHIDQLCRLLSTAKGKDRAITLQDLAERIGISRREVEQLIEANLARLPFVLVAGATGLYQPTTADDLNAYLHNLHSRHRRMQIREATIRRKARAHGWPEDRDRFVQPAHVTQQELFA